MTGILYIVATPIGNLEDITLRALRILKEVDYIAAEDTRHSIKLLSHYNIEKPLISYWSEKEKVRTEDVISILKSGKSVALISDAGTPGISDPGAILIKRAIEESVNVVPVPGPSAIITALSISGLSIDEFIFCGFLPPKQSERQRRLKELSLERRTLVFYEAPHRLIETISDILEVIGDRNAVVTKELTKIYETVYRGRVSKIYESLLESTIQGEYVIILEGKVIEPLNIDDAIEEVRLLIKKGRRRKEAVKIVAETYNISSKELYDRSLKEDYEKKDPSEQ